MTISAVASRSVIVAPSGDVQTYVPAVPRSEAPKPAAAETLASNAGTQTPSPENVARAVKKVNESFTKNGKNLFASFEKDETTGINIIKFQDKITKEVIRQYPTEEIIAIAESLDQSQDATGRLINIKA